MTATLRTSIRLNNDVPATVLVELAQEAEAAGFDQLWVSHDAFLRSAPVLLATVAARTARIHLGIGIANPYTMHPAEIAMTAATLQEVSGGRFLLGLGAGAGDFLGWVGIVQDRPLARTREALRAIRVLLAGGRPADVEGAGEGWTDQAYLRLPEVPPTPLYVGAMSPRMLELSGAEADGVLPLLFPPEHYATAADHILAGAAAAGRPAADVDIAACVWVSVHDDPDQARRPLAEKLAYYGPAFSPYLLERAGLSVADFDDVRAAMRRGDTAAAAEAVDDRMLALGIAGDPTGVVERCRWLLDAGATHLSFGPPLGPDPVAAVALLGQAVIPPLRAHAAEGREAAADLGTEAVHRAS